MVKGRKNLISAFCNPAIPPECLVRRFIGPWVDRSGLGRPGKIKNCKMSIESTLIPINPCPAIREIQIRERRLKPAIPHTAKMAYPSAEMKSNDATDQQNRRCIEASWHGSSAKSPSASLTWAGETRSFFWLFSAVILVGSGLGTMALAFGVTLMIS